MDPSPLADYGALVLTAALVIVLIV